MNVYIALGSFMIPSPFSRRILYGIRAVVGFDCPKMA